MSEGASEPRVLITGASGYIGQILVQDLSEMGAKVGRVVATSRRDPSNPLPHIQYERLDVRDKKELLALCKKHAINRIVHLAAVVTPKGDDTRDIQYQTDVVGMQNVLDACSAFDMEQLVYTSSGAAYGYSALNDEFLKEQAPLRGNKIFAYAWHKKLIEEMLEEHRTRQPSLKQLIFRVSAILGPDTKNQITDIFTRPVVTGLVGCQTPFTFVWDRDVAQCLAKGLSENSEGIYNLTGDGYLTLRQIAKRMERPYIPVPIAVVKGVITVLRALGITKMGPEQVLYLQHRPVMDNRHLKEGFLYTPKASKEVFELFAQSAGV